jgi:hypothetical protein
MKMKLEYKNAYLYGNFGPKVVITALSLLLCILLYSVKEIVIEKDTLSTKPMHAYADGIEMEG